jgi:hypothetical protein
MKNNVVYFLGAGFSQPLGIPVMKDFYLKGKDLYYKNPGKYGYFLKVIKEINELDKVQKFFKSDLFNIEEILSLLETRPKKKTKEFVKFISDVVRYYTPGIKKINRSDISNPKIFSDLSNKNIVKIRDFTNKDLIGDYAKFVAGLFPIKFECSKKDGNLYDYSTLSFSMSENSDTSYSIITLNYDMVIENFISFLNDSFSNSVGLKCLRSSSNQSTKKDNSIYLVKLHGSIHDGSIIPPTFNKNLQNGQIKYAWNTAYNLLRNAQHIRIIGYSLPETDNNIRYLLKKSISESPNLHYIDVICLDESGEVRKKYDDFIRFNFYRFFNVGIEYYLGKILDTGALVTSDNLKTHSMECDFLEKAHEDFLKQYSKKDG